MQLYGIIDCARTPELYDLVESSIEHRCLFSGNLAYPLNHVAPYLVRLDEGSALLEAWQNVGWGQNWGILCFSSRGIGGLRRHLRNFLQVKLADGRVVLFRFYDPRVWRTYMSSCAPGEADAFFGPAHLYRAETPDGLGTLQYELKNGRMMITNLTSLPPS